MLWSAASVLMPSISSRALLDSPPGAGAFIVTVAICTLLSKRGGVSIQGPGMGNEVPSGFSGGIVIGAYLCKGPGQRAAMRAPPKNHNGGGHLILINAERRLGDQAAKKSLSARLNSAGRSMLEIWPAPGSS